MLGLVLGLWLGTSDDYVERVPYVRALRAYFKLHLSYASESRGLNAAAAAMGLPCTFTSAAESSAAWLLVFQCVNWARGQAAQW